MSWDILALVSELSIGHVGTGIEMDVMRTFVTVNLLTEHFEMPVYYYYNYLAPLLWC